MLLRHVLAVVAAALVLASRAAAQDAGVGAGTDTAGDGDSLEPGAPGDFTFEPGKGMLEFRLSIYDRPDDGAGNPFLDESLTVIEPIVVLDYDVSESFGYGFDISYDNVSSASIDRLSKFPEQSGASGDYYAGIDARFRHKLSDPWTLGWNVGVSTEYDYTSIHAGANARVESEDRNRALTFSLSGFFDDVQLIRYNGVDEGNDSRTSIAGTVQWYQVMTPSTHGEFGVTVAQQTGFLSTPFNAVVLEDPTQPPNSNLDNDARGTEFPEVLPDNRLRTALFGRVRTLLRPTTAVELGGRLYTDDWGIGGVSVEPRLYQSIGPRSRLRFRYRYYTQTPSKYYEEHYEATTPGQTTFPDEFRTQDSDLGDFDSSTFGAKWIFDPNLSNRFDFGVDYILRSDGLDVTMASFGWRWSF